jgi:glutamate/tyrosine decarboxylase-like PLP-dependent enzyme
MNTKTRDTHARAATLDMPPDEFRRVGHRLVDQIADFLVALPDGRVTPAEPAATVRKALQSHRALPEDGADPERLLNNAAELLFEHSLFNGHPRFLGYITSSAAPIGALGDFLTAAVNPNAGSWTLAPMATEIEAQTVRWIADLIGYSPDAGGLLVSGGNMANFVGFLAARRAKAGGDIRTQGVNHTTQRLLMYGSVETHTWIQKAADLFGLGTDSIRWIPADAHQRMNVDALRRQIDVDRQAGHKPFLVVGTAGTVSTGAIDPLRAIGAVCREFDLWFHVDGAYGALAAALPPQDESAEELRGLAGADSIAVDPHKWLYAPLEAGCVLVRRPDDLRNAFTYRPPYYHLQDDLVNYVDYGPQNSRGFRALKVWLALQQAGRAGYVRMISDDIALARRLHQLVHEHPRFEPITQNLSITTFRYVPSDLQGRAGEPETEEYLNRLNQNLLTRIEKSGEAFLSNAVVGGKFVLRACVVNFRTSSVDIDALPGFIARLGGEADQCLRSRPVR